MDKEQIDKFFEYLFNSNSSAIINMLDVNEDYKKLVNKEISEDEFSDILYRAAIQQIEVGDYEYLQTKMNSENKDEKFITQLLISYSQDKNKLRNLIDRREDILDIEILYNALITLGDSNLTISILENPDERKKFRIWELRELLKSLNDPEYIRECIEGKKNFELNSHDVATLITSLNDPKYIRECIEGKKNLELNSRDIVTLIISLNEPEYTREWIEGKKNLELNSHDIVTLITSLNEPEYTREWIEEKKNFELNSHDIATLITSLNEPEYTREWIEGKKFLKFNSYDIACLINSISSIEYTDRCIERRNELGLSSNDIVHILTTTSFPELVTKWLKNSKELNLSSNEIYNCLLNRYSSNKIVEVLEEYNEPELWREHRIVLIGIQAIYSNLDFYLEKEGRLENKDIILRMYQKNNDILKADFDILDYIKYLGEDKINLLSCYRDISDIFKTLSSTKLFILKKCIDFYETKIDTDEWTYLASKILSNINNIDESLLQKILDYSTKEEINVENLIQLLIDGNNLDISTVEEFNNYEEIKKLWCDKAIQSENIDECRRAVLEKIFDQNLQETQDILNKYGNDIDKIEDESLKSYIRALQEIIKCSNITILKELYNVIEPVKLPNIIAMERLLKTEYAKLYNKEILFKVEDAIKNEELGENVYEAGTEFSMIITSIGAYRYHSPGNFEKDWNRPALGSQHFCTCFIRNDMLGQAPIPYVCFGFESMREDSLLLSGATDIYSSGVSFISTANHGEAYYSPDTQINKTTHHNEMCWRRIQGENKKQPDYIVVYRVNGQINSDHWNYAKQAQSDFGGKLPIVIVDVDACLENERNKVNEMIANYKLNPSPEKLAQIRQKIKNNGLTCKSGPISPEDKKDFCNDINLEELELLLNSGEMSKDNDVASNTVTQEELQKCYKETTPEERESEAKKIATLIKAIEFER